MWVHRTHTVHTPVRKNSIRIRRKYLNAIRDGVFPTQSDIDAWIISFSSLNTPSVEAPFSFEVSHEMFNDLILHESFDQYYKDLHRGDDRVVVGSRTRGGVCTICLCYRQTKIKVEPCKHVFHRTCIEEWVAWKNTCPTCQTPLTLLAPDIISTSGSSGNATAETKTRQ
jgi:hypothetical protein